MTSKDEDAKVLDAAAAKVRDARGKEAAEILEHPAVRNKILAIADEADKRQRNKVAAIFASVEATEIKRLKEELRDARTEVVELKAEIARLRASRTRAATSF